MLFSVRKVTSIRCRECVRDIKSNSEELALQHILKYRHNCGEVEYTMDIIKHTNKAVNEHQRKFPYIL
jgi:hypothetical protein